MVNRDNDILDSFAINRVHTRDTLGEAHFSGCEPNAVTKVISRLRKEDLIIRDIAPGGGYYYRLKKGPALGPDALITNLAIVTFCSATANPRLSNSQMRQYFHFMPKDGAAYCLTGEGLCHLRVDLGGDADVIVRKLRARHRGMFHIDGYRFLIQTGRYSARILTATVEKATEIQRYLSMSPPPYPVEAVVVPAIFPLIARRSP